MSNSNTNDKIFFAVIPANLTLPLDEASLKRYTKDQWVQIATLAGINVTKKLSSRKKIVVALRKYMKDNSISYSDLRKSMIDYNQVYKIQMEKEELLLAGKHGISSDNKKDISTVSPPSPPKHFTLLKVNEKLAQEKLLKEKREKEEKEKLLKEKENLKRQQQALEFQKRKEFELEQERKKFELERKRKEQEAIEKALSTQSSDVMNYKAPRIQEIFDQNGMSVGEFYVDKNGKIIGLVQSTNINKSQMNNNNNNNYENINNGEEFDLNRNTGCTPMKIRSEKNYKRSVVNRNNISFMNNKLTDFSNKIEGISTKAVDNLGYTNGMYLNINNRLDELELVSKKYDLLSNSLIDKDRRLKKFECEMNDAHKSVENLTHDNNILKEKIKQLEIDQLKIKQLEIDIKLDKNNNASNLNDNTNQDKPIISDDNKNDGMDGDNDDDSDDDDEFTFKDLENECIVSTSNNEFNKAGDFDVMDEKYNQKVVKIAWRQSSEWKKKHMGKMVMKFLREKGFSSKDLEIRDNKIKDEQKQDVKINLVKLGKQKPWLAQVYFKDSRIAIAFIAKCKDRSTVIVDWWKNQEEIRLQNEANDRRRQLERNNRNWNNFNDGRRNGNYGGNDPLLAAAQAANGYFNNGNDNGNYFRRNYNGNNGNRNMNNGNNDTGFYQRYRQ